MNSENQLRIKNKGEKMGYWGKLGYLGTHKVLVQG